MLMNLILTAVDSFLKTSGVDPQAFEPWVALRRYLSRKGGIHEFTLEKNPIFCRLVAMGIKNALAGGEHRSVLVDYVHQELPMQTPGLPYLGQFLDGRFNEVTATIGGFTAQFMGDHYLIVDRYDWYGVTASVDVPAVLHPVIERAPQWLLKKLGAVRREDGNWAIDQAGMIHLGVSFDTIVKIPTWLVDQVSEADFEGGGDQGNSNFTGN